MRGYCMSSGARGCHHVRLRRVGADNHDAPAPDHRYYSATAPEVPASSSRPPSQTTPTCR